MVGASGSASGMGSSWFLALLGLNAGGTLIKYRVHVLEVGNSFDVLVGMVEIRITGMTHVLMPEESLSSRTDGLDRGGIMNVLVERERMKLGGDGLKLSGNVLLSPLVIVVDVEDGGQATFVSKSSIGFKGQVNRSGRGCIRISLLKERKEQGKRVALAIVKLSMHKHILSRATFVAGVIGPASRFMELVDGFGAGVLQALASSPNKVAFINNHHINVRMMEARNGKITSRSRSRDVIETKTNWDNMTAPDLAGLRRMGQGFLVV